jgi:hypothetical protein
MPDPYDARRLSETADLKRKLAMRNEKPFCAMGHSGRTFDKSVSTYYDADIKLAPSKSPTSFLRKNVEHDRAFVPS